MPSHLEAVARVLDAERALTVERLADLRRSFEGIVAASADSNADDEHDPEGATIAFERSQVAALIAQARYHLAELEAAARRLAQGDFGRCEVCSRDIALERLRARPVARTCRPCAETT